MSNPPFNPLMAQAQQSFQNPSAQATPQQAQTGPGILQHPVVQAIIKALQSGTQAYGWTSMFPQEREQRTALEQQKAEAMSRLAMQQQQLGLEQQRVGYEGQRTAYEGQKTAAEVGEAGARKKLYETQTGEEPKRTALREREVATQEKTNISTIAHQRAMEDYEKSQLGQKAKQLEEEVRSHKAEEQLGAGRNTIMAADAKTAAARVQMEEQHYDQQMQLSGVQVTRQVIEDKRKAAHDALNEYYKEHPTLGMFQGSDGIQKMHQDIDTKYDQQLQQGAQVGGMQPSISGAMQTLKQAQGSQQRMPGNNVGPVQAPTTQGVQHFYYGSNGQRQQ